jgi:hypothetical protein
MRGQIVLPVATGKKELCWYVGRADVNGLNLTSFTTQVQTNKDADFVCRRMWLTQFPRTTVGADQAGLRLPPQTSVRLKDGVSGRPLSLLAGFNRAMIIDADPALAQLAFLGLGSPFLMRGNTNLFAEIVNPGAAVTAWQGDVYLIMEGYKVFPNQPEDIPRTIEAYSLPYVLSRTTVIAQPIAASGDTLAGQSVMITNDGDGQFLAKGLCFQAIDAAGLDVTAALMQAIGLQITDSTSGTRPWIQDATPDVGPISCPLPVLSINRGFLPFNTPRLLDENAVVKMQFVFPPFTAALVYLAGIGTWPLTVTVGFYGSRLPR